MKKNYKIYSIRLISILLWLGFVLAISFMEAPLKFQAPSVTLAIGLEIGKIVFHALNKVEWIWMVLLGTTSILSGYNRRDMILLISLFVILLIQTFYLFPILDVRADMVIAGQTPEDSYVHVFYIILDVVKVIVLSVAAYYILRDMNENV